MSEKEKYEALLESLGLTLGEGSGDYTRDRHQWLDQMTLEEIFRAMQRAEEDDDAQYEEVW